MYIVFNYLYLHFYSTKFIYQLFRINHFSISLIVIMSTDNTIRNAITDHPLALIGKICHPKELSLRIVC